MFMDAEQWFMIAFVTFAQVVQTLLFMVWYKYYGAQHAAAKAKKMIAEYLQSEECLPAVVALVQKFVENLFPMDVPEGEKPPTPSQRMGIVAKNLAVGIVDHFHKVMIGAKGRAVRDAKEAITGQIDNATGGLLSTMDVIEEQIPEKLRWITKLPQFQSGLADILSKKESASAVKGGGSGWIN